MSGTGARLATVSVGWFTTVMGLTGLALAWLRAQPLLGDGATAVALSLGGLAILVFVLLSLVTLVRIRRHPEAWQEDLRHPVRHPFVATLPIGLLLLATLASALFGPGTAARVAWWIGSLAQVGGTVWVLARWWRGNQPDGLQWVGITPALFIPVVGNVLAPLAGVTLGHPAWAAAQFGIGLLFWPVVLALVAARVMTQGLWPERLRPAAFIVIAPPAVVGLGLLQFGAPTLVAWACWGLALFGLLWAATVVPAIAAQPFALPHWAMSFPLAALAALSLRLTQSPEAAGTLFQVLALALLALATLIVAGLALGTLRGLRNGSLLVPEPGPAPATSAKA